MFKLLQRSQVDIALTSYIDGIQVLEKLKLEKEIMVSEPLAGFKLYHYIHKDHQALVSTVDNIIKRLENSGKLAEIIARAERAVLNTDRSD